MHLGTLPHVPILTAYFTHNHNVSLQGIKKVTDTLQVIKLSV